MKTSPHLIEWLTRRPEFGSQTFQRRCFVASSYKKRTTATKCIHALRQAGVLTWSFSSCEFSFDEQTWEGMSLKDAFENPEVQDAARADRAFLETLSRADFLLLLLPSGFSTGWETGYAAAQGAYIVVVGENDKPDIPLLHADAFFRDWPEAVSHIVSVVTKITR